MSFNKKQAKEIVRGIERTHKTFFRLAARVSVGADMKKLNHFPQMVIDVKHPNLKSVFHEFRKRFPHGQFLLIIVCGEDVPPVPPDNQPIRQWIAKIRGKFTPKHLAPVLSLDTNWLDKAFEYQKRLNY